MLSANHAPGPKLAVSRSSDGARVLQLAPIGTIADRILADRVGAVRLWEVDSDRWLAAWGRDVELVVTSVRHGCSASMMDNLPALKAICSWGVGVETIDTAAAHSRGVAVSNTPGVLDECVADLAWGLMLGAARRIGEADRYVRAGEWRAKGEFPLSTRIWGKRLGILGLGRIGSAIARRAAGFAMEIRYHGRTRRVAEAFEFEPSLAALARWSDVLVVACIGGPETRHLVTAEVLEALGPRGVLVNVARGSVVDMTALIRALEDGSLGCAGLDVLEGEPGAPAALMASERVVLTPHVGSATTETREAMEQLVIANVETFLADGRLLTPVN
jgi:lactate dehydrogenase-like 2-hydroxyacid dehydrogenase